MKSGFTLDPRRVAAYVAKLDPRRELVYRLAFRGLCDRCRGDWRSVPGRAQGLSQVKASHQTARRVHDHGAGQGRLDARALPIDSRASRGVG